MIPDLGPDEPLEDGLPEDTTAVDELMGTPTMIAVPIPPDFVPDAEPDLADLPMDPLD